MRNGKPQPWQALLTMRIARASLRALRGLLVSFALLFLVVTFTPLVKAIAFAIDQDWYDANGEVLVVLGSSMFVAGTGRDATLGQDTYLRCVYASWILQHQKFEYVVVSGGEGAAEAMAHFLSQNGVDKESILLENRSESTYQNALYTKRLLEQRLGHTPAVVILTSDYHAWRARRVFTRAGLRAYTIAVPDVIKRSSFLAQRWPAFVTLLNEFGKDGVYFAQGRI